MFSMNKFFQKLSNPVLFYVDNNGNSVFKNYAILKKDGYLYRQKFSIQDAGKVLEFKMESDKKLHFIQILLLLICYWGFIQAGATLFRCALYIIIWIIFTCICRLFCAIFYDRHIKKTFGQFEVSDFKPYISKKKSEEFKINFRSKIILFLLVVFVFSIPGVLSYNLTKLNLNSKKPNYKVAVLLTNFYNSIYPKSSRIYDMSAYAKYMTDDNEGALNDYKKLFTTAGSGFSKRDYTRFANLLFLEKKLYGSQNAIDSFNEFSTQKRMNLMEQTKMLWIKSIFSISNNVAEFVISDYDDLLSSLSKKDKKNEFYILCDKAYMSYLLGQYKDALVIYNNLISYAMNDSEIYKDELKSLYAERGYTKRRLGDNIGADTDFLASEINLYDIAAYEPAVTKLGFVVEKF